MGYLECEQAMASASHAQADSLKDIAESLRIISGRTSLKENRLRETIEKLYHELNYTFDENEREAINKRISDLENEIHEDRLKREEAKCD